MNNDNNNEGGPAKGGSNDNGASVRALVSLSKEGNNTTSDAPLLNTSSLVGDLVETRYGKGKDTNTDKFESEDMPSHVPNDIKKERTLLRPLIVPNSKHNKGDFVENSSSKDRSGKKHLRTSDKEVDPSASRECHD